MYLYVLIAIFLLVIIYGALTRKKIYSQVDRLEDWKIEIMNRPITDEISKVKGLTMSGETEEKFESWRSAWDDIIGEKLPDLEELLFDVEEVANKYRFSKAKKILAIVEQQLNEVEVDLNAMLADIHNLIHSEEQNREDIVSVRKFYSEVNDYFSLHRGSLGSTARLFNERLEELENGFETFEEATEEGNYFEAREVLLAIQEQLVVEQKQMEEVPKLFVQLQSNLPLDVENLKQGIKDMEHQGYVLDHFSFDEEIEKANTSIKEILNDVEALELDGIEERIEEVNHSLEHMYDALEHEVKAKHVVETELNGLGNQLDDLKVMLSELRVETETVQRSYLIAEEELKMHETIGEHLKELQKQLGVIDDVTANKRQSYTTIEEMVATFKETLEQVQEEISNSKQMLATLRQDELRARDTLRELRRKMLDGKRLVQKSNIPGLPSGVIDEIESGERKLIEAAEKLEEVPLQMTEVNQKIDEALVHVNGTNEYIMETLKQAADAERLIQYGNRYRSRSRAIHEQLLEAEECFRNFYYEDAIDIVLQAIEPFDPNVIEALDTEQKKEAVQ
ncbi:septation ring formation regulator EzrA [Desertibacillus haloalkaliphilus]|uniref:septation ring formation regulator EzrA n=1 Tax=Desertibacillus haloalkaliphilus TaxID=1328930 RepID=UPI001C2659B1|nr:septation ring formation regulator EzrA [Desertibacillus haloalkaliphilus]MBU8905201.1 septation ring formation regulator EzrA [Desertibacillus haloalkaliphilus]